MSKENMDKLYKDPDDSSSSITLALGISKERTKELVCNCMNIFASKDITTDTDTIKKLLTLGDSLTTNELVYVSYKMGGIGLLLGFDNKEIDLVRYTVLQAIHNIRGGDIE